MGRMCNMYTEIIYKSTTDNDCIVFRSEETVHGYIDDRDRFNLERTYGTVKAHTLEDLEKRASCFCRGTKYVFGGFLQP